LIGASLERKIQTSVKITRPTAGYLTSEFWLVLTRATS